MPRTNNILKTTTNMAEKFNSNETIDNVELARQLRQPEGKTGKLVGQEMNKGNKHICLNTYKVLAPVNDENILEIGMGNGYFVKDLLSMAKNLTYSGVDFSETMIQEANEINKALIESETVSFKHASIEYLPFDNDTFDCITTTNTLYFWPAPKENIKELLRVLKPGGRLLVAYRSKDCMDQLELTRYNFTKYFPEDVEALFKSGGFNQVSTQLIKEPELEFDGKAVQMEGIYTVGIKSA